MPGQLLKQSGSIYGGGSPGVTGGGISYLDRAKALLAPYGLVQYLPLGEVSGLTAYDYSGNARNGTYGASVTLAQPGIDSDYAALFAAAVDNYVSISGTSFNAAWNPHEFTLSLWINVSSTVWTDTSSRIISYFYADNDNRFFLSKSATNNTLTTFLRYGAATAGSCSCALCAYDGWIHVAVKVSKADQTIDLYINGGQPDTSMHRVTAAIGTWAGTPSAAVTRLGYNQTIGKLQHYSSTNAASTLPLSAIRTLAKDCGQVIFDGDSRTAGAPTMPMYAMGNTLATPKFFRFNNLAVTGQKWSDMSADIAATIPAIGNGANWVIGWAGINDACNSVPIATIAANMEAYAALVHAAGYKFALCTEIDAQSAAANAVNYHTTLWAPLNVLYRASTFYDALIELDLVTELQDATNATYFSDALHQTVAGKQVVGAAIAAKIATFS